MCIQGFDGETDHLADPGVDGRIILKWTFGRWDVGVLSGSDRNRWRALVTAVTNHRVL